MHQEIIDFWFQEIDPAKWWVKDPEFDQLIRDKFLTIYEQAKVCELYTWRTTAKGRLAEVIVLDQFPRNMFRGTALSFATDSLALTLSQEAVSIGADQALTTTEKSFLYMPFMHSESLGIHQQAVKLFELNGNESNLKFEIKHKEIIEKYGRYPHRNEILGRESKQDELVFLTQPGSGF